MIRCFQKKGVHKAGEYLEKKIADAATRVK